MTVTQLKIPAPPISSASDYSDNSYAGKTLIWWGRSDTDYSRNSIIRQLLRSLGWHIKDFRPKISAFGDLEARLRHLESADALWVPCFRQRDIGAAKQWSKLNNIPLIIDPLISAYDKQVNERKKFSPDSHKAHNLLKWERGLCRDVDLVVVDTDAHADYFRENLGVSTDRLAVVHVGAEEAIFSPRPKPALNNQKANPLQVLFFGSFIHLQGPQHIIEAARLYNGPPVSWHLLGDGPMLEQCKQLASGLENVTFEAWIPYQELPRRIQSADILLGVFGATPKAGRIIPNKVFQAMACAKPVITRLAPAYPETVRSDGNGLVWVEPGNPQDIADAVRGLAEEPNRIQPAGNRAATCFRNHFSSEIILHELFQAFSQLPIKKNH